MNATDALVDALRGADLGEGVRVGDAEARDTDGPLTGRYLVVRPRTETPGEGTAASPDADRNPEVQITAVGPSRRAADQLAEAGRTVALGLDPPDGWAWLCVPEFVTGTGTTPEPDTDPTAPEAPSFFRTDVYRYYLTPA